MNKLPGCLGRVDCAGEQFCSVKCQRTPPSLFVKTMKSTLTKEAKAAIVKALVQDSSIDGIKYHDGLIYIPTAVEQPIIDKLRKEKDDPIIPFDVADFPDEASVRRAYKRHIRLLHQYNEIKDVVQAMLGKLAHIRGLTTSQLYPEYELDPED